MVDEHGMDDHDALTQLLEAGSDAETVACHAEAATAALCEMHHRSPAAALQMAISIAAATGKLSRAQRVLGADIADRLSVVCQEAQCTEIALLRTLQPVPSESRLGAPLRCLFENDNFALLKAAVDGECTLLLSTPEVRMALQSLWLGPQWEEAACLHSLNVAAGAFPTLVRGFQFMALLANVLLLPIIALAPTAGRWLDSRSKWLVETRHVEMPSGGSASWHAAMVDSKRPLRFLFGSFSGHCYFLGAPVFKFAAQLVSNCVLVLTLVMLPSPTSRTGLEHASGMLSAASDDDSHMGEKADMLTLESGLAVASLLAMVIAGGIRFGRDRISFISDPINMIETSGAALASTSLLLLLLEVGDAQGALSLALILMVLAQGFRLLSLPSGGERLFLVVARLTRVVANYVILQAIVVSAFAAGLTKLLGVSDLGGEGCGETVRPYTASVGTAAVHLLQLSTGSVAADDVMACFDSSTNSASVMVALMVYLLTSAVILFGLLVATLATAYRDVEDAVEADAGMVFVRRVLLWLVSPVAPSPLLLLGIPDALVTAAAQRCRANQHTVLDGHESFEEQWKKWSGQEWPMWRDKHPVEELAKTVSAYVSRRLRGGLEARLRSSVSSTLQQSEERCSSALQLFSSALQQREEHVQQTITTELSSVKALLVSAGGLAAAPFSSSHATATKAAPNPADATAMGKVVAAEAVGDIIEAAVREVEEAGAWAARPMGGAMAAALDAKVDQTWREMGRLGDKVDQMGTQMSSMQATLDDVKALLKELQPKKPKQSPCGSPLNTGSPHASVASLVTPAMAAAQLQRLAHRPPSRSPKPTGDALHRTRQIRYGVRGPNSPAALRSEASSGSEASTA